MIKAIIFDNHGVLTSSDEETILSPIAEYLGVSVPEYEAIWKEVAKPLDVGDIDIDEFYRRVLNQLGVQRDIGEIKKLHFSKYIPKPEVQDFAKSLKGKFKLCLLTNFSNMFDECNKEWKLEKIFDDNIVVSYKVKMRKPNEDIFLYTLEKLNVKPGEAILVDDKEDNLEEAKSLGMVAIKFTSLEKLKEDLEKYIKIETNV